MKRNEIDKSEFSFDYPRNENLNLINLATESSWYDFYYLLRIEREWFTIAEQKFRTESLIENRFWVADLCKRVIGLLNIILDEDVSIEINYDDPKATQYKLVKYVNIKNVDRFLSTQNQKNMVKDRNKNNAKDVFMMDEIRKEKASYLYNKFRHYFLRYIWD